MKVGLVGFQGGGKSALFQLLTGQMPDPSKVQSGQIGEVIVPDARFDKLVELFHPKKIVPAKIQLFDTPGLIKGESKSNGQRLGIIRESAVLIQVVGVYSGADPLEEVTAFTDECILADLQVVTNRIERVKKDLSKPKPATEREQMQAELDALGPLETVLTSGKPIRSLTLTDDQLKATRAFSLITGKPILAVLNSAESKFNQAVIDKLAAQGITALAAPVGLEQEIEALSAEDRAVFAEEMGLTESSKSRLARSVFEITDQITFYTCDEKEVHAWLLNRGETAVEAAGTIHTDLAKNFIRAEIMKVDDLLRLGSEKEVKAAGLFRLEGKEYVMQDGDEIVVRANV